jgi:hypothetical protein
MVVAIVVVLMVAFVWAFMTAFMVWQKDAPMSTDQYRETVERNLASSRRTAAFMRRTLWPVVLVCGAIAVVLIVIINA